MHDRELSKEELVKKIKTETYQGNTFLQSIFDSLEDYLNNKPSHEFKCTDCGKMTRYQSLYHLSDAIITCHECNVSRRIKNY